MSNLYLVFILSNIANVIIQTTKSIFTIKGGKWSASIVNAIAYGFYTYIIVITATFTLPLLEKCIIVGACNLVGVFVVKFIEEKCQKDKLWIYQATAKENLAIVDKICKLLKDMDIACIYNEVIPNRLYSMQIFSYSPKESDLIKTLLDNYNVKYCATETKEAKGKKKNEKKF